MKSDVVPIEMSDIERILFKLSIAIAIAGPFESHFREEYRVVVSDASGVWVLDRFLPCIALSDITVRTPWSFFMRHTNFENCRRDRSHVLMNTCVS